MSYIGESRRKAEIEAKRAKLAELKRARLEREQRLAANPSSSSAAGGWSQSRSDTPTSRKDLDDLVSSLVNANTLNRTQRSSLVGSDFSPASPGKSAVGPASSEFGGSEAEAAGAAPTAISGSTAVHRDGFSSTIPTPAAPAFVPELIDVETELFEFPQRERVYYTKEVQTATFDGDNDEAAGGGRGGGALEAAGGVGSEARDAKAEEAIRAKILQEQADEAASRREEEKLEREIEEQLRELTDDERLAIYGASDFSEFVEHSSKIVERALADTYDYMKDYTVTGDGLEQVHEGRQLRLVRTFGDDRVFANRSITDLDWSTQHPELCVASYNRNDMANDDPDGLVAVWNLHLRERPEFTFHAQTDVLSVRFSPFQPNLVIGGTYSGQILIWDTRARALPVLKTPLSAAGHTHPVYALNLVGTQNAHNLVSASTDGNVCSWTLDMLASPQETMLLVKPSHPKTDEVGVTALAFPDQETASFWIGTEEGNVYPASRYDRASQKAGLNTAEVYRGHAAPITGLDFHPLSGAVDFSDLFITSSMDWTAKLWRVKGGNAVVKGTGAGAATPSMAPAGSSSSSAAAAATAAAASSAAAAAAAAAAGGSSSMAAAASMRAADPSSAASMADLEPVLSFEESSDYVYDVKWHPYHPAVFAQVDGSGRLDVYNLNIDTERPYQTTTIPTGRAVNKLAWDRKEGRRIAVGGADGKVYVYDTGELFCNPTDDDFREFQSTMASLLKRGGSGGAVNGEASKVGVGLVGPGR
ncbi:uncharacterized protein PFL1_01356 [Pseudozyma flocculosa PF-1]|uniref:Related to Dynein intermediate chain 1, cytosolic n=1 Tax=Pseudozyma flocculosa TaxID=84751 RepID=A0A5C3EYW5_9BASI|nr:uncharacterized protein PFL1_01356 [Pseudozyma flocculosa PF-1]EPQ31168.1 hypothetical protein PFL1_01356 [Pseudozyma flocculosa PF-1]SPO36339.1 related to Dynein intermediate chain 1, cytosolic [Pseudozyma flocculosa]